MTKGRAESEPTADVDVTSGSAHRLTPLPKAPARGHLIVPAAVLAATETALRGFNGPDGEHEGIIFWAGRKDGADHLVASALVPRARHGIGFVDVSADEVGKCLHQARTRRLVVVAQTHSHPGDDVRHSDADDTLVLMPHEGLFSAVAGRYGHTPIRPWTAGIHQFQDGRWFEVSNPDEALIITETVIRA